MAPPVSDRTNKLISFFISFMQMINFIFFGFIWPTMTMSTLNHYMISQECFFFFMINPRAGNGRNRISASFKRTTRRRKRKKNAREYTIPLVSKCIKIAINGSHNKYFAARKRRRRKNQMFAENFVYLLCSYLFAAGC